MAPVEGRAQRLVPRERRSVAAREQAEAVVETDGEILQPERRGAGRRQLDGEGDAVEAPTDRADDHRAARVRREAPVHRSRPRHEQLDGGGFQQMLPILGSLRRQREREHAIDVLPRRAERLAAGRHDAGVRIGVQQSRGHAGRRLDDVLAIVQHEQDTLGADRRRHPLG